MDDVNNDTDCDDDCGGDANMLMRAMKVMSMASWMKMSLRGGVRDAIVIAIAMVMIVQMLMERAADRKTV